MTGKFISLQMTLTLKAAGKTRKLFVAPHCIVTVKVPGMPDGAALLTQLREGDAIETEGTPITSIVVKREEV